jgi:uncharacterized membrane protein
MKRSRVWAVNNRNQAVGWSELAGRDTEHAILWQGGELIDVGAVPDFPVSRARGINERGQIVGHVTEFDLHRSRAILWDDGRAIDISPPGSSCIATDINNRGEIIGKCTAAGELWRGRELITLGLLAGYTGNFPTAPSRRCVAKPGRLSGRRPARAFHREASGNSQTVLSRPRERPRARRTATVASLRRGCGSA